ncbi:lactate utilization protein B [Patulibacter americanus]|uniref:lactate utilization protein B n=1 Tax=Patulibacter americanus TaxID=588672 RepID=UPI0003B59619|nr:lactate utilization protein B [Patulibacter americanus]
MSARWPETPVDFPKAAHETLKDSQLRSNLGHATTAIRAKREDVVSEVDDWESLRDEGAAARDRSLRRLDEMLVRLEESVTAAGGHVHWAADKESAQRLVVDLVKATGSDEVIKVKSLLTDELELNPALQDAGIHAQETDLAELIVQLGGDRQSHILVPAIHRNRREIRDIFRRELPGAEDVSDDPAALAEAARRHLREQFLRVPVAISGANAAVAETGTVAVVESEGNGRMCLTMPKTLITVMGIEKVLERWEDLGTIMRLLPRSSTGERMNPYTSLWTGVTPDDGPEEFHLVLVDAGRTNALADPVGRDTLRCIRCSACLNVCPVYERTGGQAYESIYPGPIGAILTPQLQGLDTAPTLPWASSLCGACYEVCPVKIDIPKILVHLRGRVTAETNASGKGHHAGAERLAMRSVARVMDSRRAYEAAQKAGRLGLSLMNNGRGARGALPGLSGWTGSRDLPDPERSFRDWWREREAGELEQGPDAPALPQAAQDPAARSGAAMPGTPGPEDALPTDVPRLHGEDRA